jgi:hypothetical protein
MKPNGRCEMNKVDEARLKYLRWLSPDLEGLRDPDLWLEPPIEQTAIGQFIEYLLAHYDKLEIARMLADSERIMVCCYTQADPRVIRANDTPLKALAEAVLKTEET